MRRHDRRSAELPVLVSTAGGTETKGGITLDASDVSEGGAFLRSDLLFEIGETLHLEIPLPSGQVVKANGRVVRVSHQTGGAGMGIQFIDLGDRDRRALASSLGKLAAGKAEDKTAGKTAGKPARS